MIIEESRIRSVIKALVLRVIIFTLTLIYILLTGGTIRKCIELSILDMVLELTVHYVYERLWQRINWGIKIKKN